MITLFFLYCFLNLPTSFVGMPLQTDQAQSSQTDLNHALIAAAEKGDIPEIKRLLDKGADVNTRDDCRCLTPLNASIKNRRQEAMELLIARGADVNGDMHAETPLRLASRGGNPKMIDYLLAHGAVVRDSSGNSLNQLRGQTEKLNEALFHALESNPFIPDTYVALLLLHLGADPNARDKNGSTPLIFIISRSSVDDPFMQSLIRSGADVNAVNKYGESVLMAGVRSPDHDRVVRFLVKKGAKVVNGQSASEDTALMRAVRESDSDLVQFLVDQGAGVNVTDRNHPGADRQRITALMWAAWSKEAEQSVAIIRILISHGAEVNVADSRGWTALAGAVFYGDISIVQELLRHGADVNVRSDDGKTLLQIVQETSRPDKEQIIALLKQAGEKE